MRTKEFKENKGITLIALVVTIIVLLLLAGVAVNTLAGENGVLNMAIGIGEKNDIGATKEDISLIVTNARINYMENAHVGNIVLTENDSTTIGQAVIDAVLPLNGTTIGKTSIEVTQAVNDNVEGDASISISTTDYVVNGTITLEDGMLTWREIEPNVPRIEGVPLTLELNTSSSITIPATLKGTTGTIQWTSSNENIATVEDGVVTASSTITKPSEKIIITVSATGCEDRICTVTVTKGLTAKEILTINPSATEAEEKSPYVIYKAGKNIDDTTNGETNEILCRVLYNDDTHGLQLISLNPVTDVTIGRIGSTGITSYSSAIVSLNNYSEAYLDNDGIAIDARCVGSISTINKDASGLVTGFKNKDGRVYQDKWRMVDCNYKEDKQQLTGIGAYSFSKKANGLDAETNDRYWLASKEKTDNGTKQTYYCNAVNKGGSQIRIQIFYTVSSYTDFIEQAGLRVVLLLDSNVKLTGTGENLGSESNPYGLKK